MLCKQFLVSALRPAHPSHDVVLRPPGPRTNSKGRPMKETLSSRYLSTVEHFLSNGVMSQVLYKRTLNIIHSDAVKLAKSQQSVNPLLGRIPPPVSASEQRLTRPFRTVLRRLRSTHCSLLMSYKFKIKAATDDLCPQCQSASQSVLHLFQCPAFPTSLTPIDLWSHPVDIARYLVTLPAFRSLPPLVISPPRPPPEPPP
jgi:hypothetical protein